MLKEDKTQKRVDRHKDTQEDFTPFNIVNEMLDKFPKETFANMDETIIDYSAGNGNFLVEALDRKLDNSKNIDDAIRGLKSIYGVELMADNVEDCRKRLYALFISRYPQTLKDFTTSQTVRSIIKNRIQWHDSLAFNYNEWPKLKKPGKKKISFHEDRTQEDTKYPMWFKDKGAKTPQLSLFTDEMFN